MRTIAYVDGLNLFYRALKGTDCKQLDLRALIGRVLPRVCCLSQIKYFSAPVRGDRHLAAQRAYLAALSAHSPEIVFYDGFFTEKKVTGRLAGTKRLATVKTLEEKCTDVNMAVEMVVDAVEDRCDCAAVLSNDGDLRGALRLVRARGKKIALMPPSPVDGVSEALAAHVDFLRRFKPRDFRRAQLPHRVDGIEKPRHWRDS